MLLIDPPIMIELKTHMDVMFNAQERKNINPKSKKYIFLGYTNGVK